LYYADTVKYNLIATYLKLRPIMWLSLIGEMIQHETSTKPHISLHFPHLGINEHFGNKIFIKWRLMF